nr:hypothetical protein [Tanacetum cinerariifolium]
KAKEEEILSLTRPEALNSSRIETSFSSQAIHLQPAEEFVVTGSLQMKQRVLDTIMKENVEEKEKAKNHSLDIPTVEQLLDKVNKQNSSVQHTQESPFDTESDILFVKSFQASQITKDVEVTLMGSRPMDMDSQITDSEFELESMLDDVLQSLSGVETYVSDSSHDVSHSEHTSWEKTASVEFQSLSGHLDHVCEEVSLLHYKVQEMESSITQKVSDDIKSSVSDLISHSLKAQLPGILSDALKTTANLKTTKDDTDYDELDKNPLSKKFKIMTPIPNFPTPTLLCSIPLEHMMKTTPHQEDPAKGKGVDVKELVNVLVPFMDEGGSNPKMTSLKPFINIEGVSTQEEFIKQLTEIKRLADLRAQEEELENALKKFLNPTTVKAQFQWVLNQANNLGLPPPPALATFGMTVEDKKRKRNETLKEVFVKERTDVDGTQRNITPPSGVVGKEGMVIREPNAGIEDQQSAKHQLAVKGLSECRASESNIRRIQVKDIVKEVEYYLKTYSSVEMDISLGQLSQSAVQISSLVNLIL